MLRNAIRNKKGDLTFGQIITAIIALIVLVVIIMIFTGKMQGIVAETESCKAKGGICTPNKCPEGSLDKYGEYGDCSESELCCIKLFDS